MGSLGLSRLSVWWVAFGIDLERGRPGHPQDNGAHERMHLDISREIEAMGQSDQDALDLWRQSFNYERPQEALWDALSRPRSIALRSENMRAHPMNWSIHKCALDELEPKEQSKWITIGFFLSTALAGWNVGLKPTAQERLEVWFGRLLLGEIDLAASNFIRADIRPNKTANHHRNV